MYINLIGFGIPFKKKVFHRHDYYNYHATVRKSGKSFIACETYKYDVFNDDVQESSLYGRNG
jgi:hypothetical protein